MIAVLGSLVFTFTLAAISNLQMSSFGEHAKSGLVEVGFSLAFGVLSSALIHRVAITISLFFSVGILVFLCGIAHTRYTPGGQAHAAIVGDSKKRK